MVVLLFLSLLLGTAQALDCPLLKVRFEALKVDMIYEELMNEAERLIEEGCSRGNLKAIRSADKVLSAIENIKFSEALGEERVVAGKRLRRAGELLNETKKHADKNRTFYAYQLLFFQVARENFRVKDYNYALRYALASYNLGRALIELR